jgi:hypothetical protein
VVSSLHVYHQKLCIHVYHAIYTPCQSHLLLFIIIIFDDKYKLWHLLLRNFYHFLSLSLSLSEVYTFSLTSYSQITQLMFIPHGERPSFIPGYSR